jgi:hypothetical protein
MYSSNFVIYIDFPSKMLVKAVITTLLIHNKAVAQVRVGDSYQISLFKHMPKDGN